MSEKVLMNAVARLDLRVAELERKLAEREAEEARAAELMKEVNDTIKAGNERLRQRMAMSDEDKRKIVEQYKEEKN